MRHKTNLHFYPVRVNAHFRHVRRMQNDYLPPKAIHHSACKPGPDRQKRSGYSQLAQATRARIAISRVFGGHARCSQSSQPFPLRSGPSSTAMQDVSTKCCCTQMVGKCQGCEGGYPIWYSKREVLQNSPLVPEGWATEDVTDMLRVTFTVLGYLENGGSR